jgi:ribonuclease BN (tRNA processing enzyme)
MRILLLGTGGYHPSEQRHTACVMLPESGVIFDAGTSFFRVPERLETDEVQIFLTHAHLDHIVGLTYFLVPLLRKTVKRARLYGTPATLDAVQTHLFAEAVFPVLPSFEFVPLEPGLPIDVPGGVLSHQRLSSHPGGSTAYRIDLPASADQPARSLAYVTDTVVDGTYAEFIRGVGLLLHECYFPDGMAEWADKTGHSHTTPVARLARDSGVGRLVLLHVDPYAKGDDPLGIDTARRIFPGIELGHDLAELHL